MYDIAFVSPGFFSGGSFTLKNRNTANPKRPNDEERLRILQSLTINGQIWNDTRWNNLSAAECKEYGAGERSHGSVLLVTEDQSVWRNNGSAYNLELHRDKASDTENSSAAYLFRTIPEGLLSTPSQIDMFHFLLSRFRISYCLSLAVTSSCSLQIRLWLLLTVVVCNIVKLACFTLTLREQHGTPLVTVGDAVASFLSSPCPTVDGMCLLSEDALYNALQRDTESPRDDVGSQPRQYQATSLRYYQSISFIRWTIYSTSYV